MSGKKIIRPSARQTLKAIDQKRADFLFVAAIYWISCREKNGGNSYALEQVLIT